MSPVARRTVTRVGRLLRVGLTGFAVVAVLAVSPVAPAQEDAPAESADAAQLGAAQLGAAPAGTALGLGDHSVGRQADMGGRSRFHYSRRGRSAYGESPLYRYRGPHLSAGAAYGYAPYYHAYGYYGHPWYVGRSYSRNIHPLAEQGSLQLGLDTYEVYAYGGVFGPELPVDAEPFVDTRLPPFRGVVAAALRAKREKQVLRVGSEGALELMKAGQFREAGRRLAKEFRESRSPRYPLLLAEVFFALGKFDHAELLLQEALTSDVVSEYLPRSVRAHFPKNDVYATRLGELVGSKANALTQAYFLVHSTEPAKGIDLLHKMVLESPEDESAGILYRHYLGEAFREESAE